jgi:spore coat polysaccharide biosynthesis protein SpsF
MDIKVGFLITARLKSSRLPKKLLLKVNGEAYITWMLRRLKLAPELSEIILCTSTNPQDDELVEIAENEGVRVYRGSEEDVIQRLYDAATFYKLDYVINMTADCPLLPFELIGKLIETYKQTNADLVKCHDLPVGLFLSGLKIEAMKKVIDMKGSGHSEYWLYYFLKTNLFKVVPLDVNSNLFRPNYRLALDYPEDHQLLKRLYESLGDDAYKKHSYEIINCLDKNPEWATINYECNLKGALRTENDETSKVVFKDGTIIK